MREGCVRFVLCISFAILFLQFPVYFFWPYKSYNYDFCTYIELYILNSEEINNPKYEKYFKKYNNDSEAISIDKNAKIKHKNRFNIFKGLKNNWFSLWSGIIIMFAPITSLYFFHNFIFSEEIEKKKTIVFFYFFLRIDKFYNKFNKFGLY